MQAKLLLTVSQSPISRELGGKNTLPPVRTENKQKNILPPVRTESKHKNILPSVRTENKQNVRKNLYEYTYCNVLNLFWNVYRSKKVI